MKDQNSMGGIHINGDAIIQRSSLNAPTTTYQMGGSENTGRYADRSIRNKAPAGEETIRYLLDSVRELRAAYIGIAEKSVTLEEMLNAAMEGRVPAKKTDAMEAAAQMKVNEVILNEYPFLRDVDVPPEITLEDEIEFRVERYLNRKLGGLGQDKRPGFEGHAQETAPVIDVPYVMVDEKTQEGGVKGNYGAPKELYAPKNRPLLMAPEESDGADNTKPTE